MLQSEAGWRKDSTHSINVAVMAYRSIESRTTYICTELKIAQNQNRGGIKEAVKIEPTIDE